jgi:hypothetical protein
MGSRTDLDANLQADVTGILNETVTATAAATSKHRHGATERTACGAVGQWRRDMLER